MLGEPARSTRSSSSPGLIDEPLDLLLYSRAAVVITLIYVWIPFAALPIYASLQRIDRGHLEAAADLGAGPWTRFRRVTIPLGLPGMLAAFFMVFIPTVGEYVTPSLVGGTEGIMYGNLIQDFFIVGGELGPGLGAGGPHAGRDRWCWCSSACAWLTSGGWRRDGVRAVPSRRTIGVGRTRVPLRGVLRRAPVPAVPAHRSAVPLLVQLEHVPGLPDAGVHPALVRRGALATRRCSGPPATRSWWGSWRPASRPRSGSR